MASDGELSCTSDPNFAVICSFLERFASSCGITHPNISELQEMLENSQEVPQPLVELHVKLLRKARKSVSGERWERALIKFCHTYSNQDGWELERFGYKKARLGVKLRILKTLLEQQFDLNSKFKAEINKLSACELRSRPLGRDKLGQTYWCQLDDACNLRVYREDLDDETWEIVASDREGLVQLISQLSSNDPFHNGSDTLLNDDSNSMGPEKPITDTGQHSKSPLVEDKVEEGMSEEFKSHSSEVDENIIESDKLKVESNKYDKSNVLDNVTLLPQIQEKSDNALQMTNESISKTDCSPDTIITNSTETANGDPLNEVNNVSSIICDTEIDVGAKNKSNTDNVESSKIPGNSVESLKITDSNQTTPQKDLASVNYNVDVEKRQDEEHIKSPDDHSCSVPKLVENESLTNSKDAGENEKCINQNSNSLLKTTTLPEEKDMDVIPAKRPRAMSNSIAASSHDCVESEVGEPIEEPLMLVYGEGSGKDCDTGNPIKSSDDDEINAGSSQDKNENNLTTNVSLEGNKESELSSKTENDSTNISRPEDVTSTAKHLDSSLCDIVAKSVAKPEECSNIISTESDKSIKLNLEIKNPVLTESDGIKDELEQVKVSETVNRSYHLPNSETAVSDTSSFKKQCIHPIDICESQTNYETACKNFQMPQKPLNVTLHGNKTDLTHSNICEKEVVSIEGGGDQSETSPKLWSIDTICKSNNPSVETPSSTEAKISSKVMGMDSGTESDAMCSSNKSDQCAPLDCNKTENKLSVEIEHVIQPEEKCSTEGSSILKFEGTVKLPGTKCLNKTDAHMGCEVLPSESNCDYVPGTRELRVQEKATSNDNLPSSKNEKDDSGVSSLCIPPSSSFQDALILKQQDAKLPGLVCRESISLHKDPLSDIKSGQNKDSTEVKSSHCDSADFTKEAEELDSKVIIDPTSVVKDKLVENVSFPNVKIDRNNKADVEFAKPFMVEKCNFSDKSVPLAPAKCFSENPLATFSAQGSSKHKDVLSQKLQSMQSSGKNRRKSVESITMGIMNKLAAKSCMELPKTAQIRSIDDVIGSNSKVSNKPMHKPVACKSADIEFPESKDFQLPSKDKYLDLQGNKTNDKNQIISGSKKSMSSVFIPENLPQSILPPTESMIDPLRQLTDLSHLTQSPSFLSSSLLKKSRKDMESGVEYLRKTLDIKDTPSMVLDLHKTGKKSVDKYFESQLKMPDLTKPILDKSFSTLGLDKLKPKDTLDPTNLFKEPDLNKIAEIAMLKGFVPEPLVMKEKAWLCGSSVPLLNKPEIQSSYNLPFNIGNKTQFHDDKLRLLSGSCTSMREKQEKRVGEDMKVRDNRHVKRTETRKELGLESVINKSLAYFTAVKDMSSIHREHESSNYGMPSSISSRGASAVMKPKDSRLESSLEPQDLTISSKQNSSLGSKCDTLGKMKDSTGMQGQSINQADAKSILKGLSLKNINIEPVKEDKTSKELQNINVSNIHNQNTSSKYNTLGSAQSISIHNYETSSNSVFHTLPAKDKIVDTPIDMKVTQPSEIAKEKVHYGLKVKPLEKLSEVKLSEIKIDGLKESGVYLKEHAPDKSNLSVTPETSINLKMPGKDKQKELSVCPIKLETEREHYQSVNDEPLDKVNELTQSLKKTEPDDKPSICQKSTVDCVPKDISVLKEAHSNKLQEFTIEVKSKYNTNKKLAGRNEFSNENDEKVCTEIKPSISSVSNTECVINDIANSSLEEGSKNFPNLADKNFHDSNPIQVSNPESVVEKNEVVNSLGVEPTLMHIVEDTKASQEKSKVLACEDSSIQELRCTFEGHEVKAKVETNILSSESEIPKVDDSVLISTKSLQCLNENLEQTSIIKIDNNSSDVEDKKSISKPPKESFVCLEVADDVPKKNKTEKKTFERFGEKELIKSEINIVLEKCDRLAKNDKKFDSKENLDSVRNEPSLEVKNNEDLILERDPLEGLGDNVLCSDTSVSQRQTRSGRLKFSATIPVVTKTSKAKKSTATSTSKSTEGSVKTRNRKNKLEIKVNDTGTVESNKKRTNLRSRKSNTVEIVKVDGETDSALCDDYLQTNYESNKKVGGAKTPNSDPLLSVEAADLTEEIQEVALDSTKSSKRGKNKKHVSDVLENKLAENSEAKDHTGSTCNKKQGSKKASGKQVKPNIDTIDFESSFSEDSGSQTEIQGKTESEISLVDVNSQFKEDESTNRGRGRFRKRGKGIISSHSRGRGRGRTVTTGSTNTTESPAPSSDPPSDSTVSVKKTRKRSVDLVIEESKEEMSENPEPRMRQSRRIAQIKIKEEAERRKIEELALMQLKEEQQMRKHSKKTTSQTSKSDKKKRKQKLSDSDDDYTAEDREESSKKRSKGIKKKRKKKGSKFNKNNPWQSSSESSSSEEEEDEPEQTEEEEEEADLVFISDHEFSPESDLEEGAEDSLPMRRARTAKKGADEEEKADEHACQKCGKSDHPEWILLCDKCDCGWHGSCLRPALLVIPEGDWFCPPCEHLSLLTNLEENLKTFDRNFKRRENEELRRKRIAYVGISLDNVLSAKVEKDEASGKDSERTSSSLSSSSSSESSSGDESEPVYQLRQRRTTVLSYRYNDYDDLIYSAIQDEMEAVKGAGNQGRGKDIETIVKAGKEEEDTKFEDFGKDSSELSQNVKNEENSQVEKVPEEEDEEEEGYIPPVRKFQHARKKHRKLNSLDFSSEDDADSDEDFKGSSSDEDEDDDVDGDYTDESDVGGRRRHGKRHSSKPVRRSSRARTTRFDKEFINDDSEDSDAPRRKKSRRSWHESDSEESDWGKKKRKKTFTFKPKGQKKKRRESRDLDLESFRRSKPKKPKIVFGGLDDDDDDDKSLQRRTRGRKINYQEMAGSDTEEEVIKRSQKVESEEEFVANDEEEDEDDIDEREPVFSDDKENDSDNDFKRNKLISPVKNKTGLVRKKKQIIRDDTEDEDDEFEVKVPQLEKDDIKFESCLTQEAQPKSEKLNFPEAVDSYIKEKETSLDTLTDETGVQERIGSAIQRKQVLEKRDLKDTTVIGSGDLQDNEFNLQESSGIGSSQVEHASNVSEKEVTVAVDAVPKAGVQALKGMLESQPLRGMLGMNQTFRGFMDSQQQVIAATSPQPANNTQSPFQRTEMTQEKNSHSIVNAIPKGPDDQQGTSALKVAERDQQQLLSPRMGMEAQSPPKRKGRGRGKVNSSNAGASNTEIGEARYPLQTQHYSPQNLVSSSTSSVITRMLQAQPVSQQTPQSFTAAATAMGHKYFGSGQDQHYPSVSPSKPGRIPSPYRQVQTSINNNPASMSQHYSVRPGQVRPSPPGNSAASTLRMRVPGPQSSSTSQPPSLYHSSHHPLDPSPSGGGQVVIGSRPLESGQQPSSVVPVASGSPLGAKPSVSHSTPPPPYPRPRFPPEVPTQQAPISQSQVRHTTPFQSNHLHTQSPPPHQQGRSPSNFSSYHPPPPTYYGGYPPPPPVAAAEDALPPSAYQGSPYPDHYTNSETPHNLQASDGSNSRTYEDEGGGEFGGLVSYFSSQREDDLDT